MTNKDTDLRSILQHRLAEITEKNPRFSIRALAKKLDLSPSHLSRALRGQKGFSYQSTLRLLRELDLTHEQSERILSDFAKEKKKVRRERVTETRDQREQRILEFEMFRLISDWYHLPILELIRTKGFQSDEAWIAKRLNLSPEVVKLAIKRLASLGFVTRSQGMLKLKKAQMFNTSNDLQSLAIRKHHSQMLEKASEALTEQSVELREYQALNLNFDPEDLKDAKQEIRAFTKRFNQKFARSSGQEVYQLNLQFFALTKEGK